MSFAINIVDGCGLKNETCCQLQPKKTNDVLAVHIIVKEKMF